MEAHQQLRLLALALLIVTLGVEASSRRPLLGSQKCTWGPAYWCNGLKQSSECQATRHCIDNVWSNNPYPADDDEVCTICKNMVREARDQLLSNETQVINPLFFKSLIGKLINMTGRAEGGV